MADLTMTTAPRREGASARSHGHRASRHGRVSAGSRVLGWATAAALAALVVGVVLPLVWMVVSALKTNTELLASPWGLPSHASFRSFADAWREGVVQFLLNSVVVTVGSIILVTCVAAFGAYALTKLTIPFAGPISLLIIAGMMLDPLVTIVPLFRLLNSMGLQDTRIGLVLLYTAYKIPFSLFLVRAYMLTLPNSVDEAAKLDGANQWQIFRWVIVPLCKPVLISVAILQGLFAWNEFAFALVFLSSKSKQTLPIGLLNLQSEFATDWPTVFAAMVLAALPIMIAFLAGQRWFIRGLADGYGK